MPTMQEWQEKIAALRMRADAVIALDALRMQVAQITRNYEYTDSEGNVHLVTQGSGGKWINNQIIEHGGTGKSAWEGVTHVSAKGSGRQGGLKGEGTPKSATPRKTPEQKTAEHAAQIQQALEDWRSGRAYVDGNGNYHVRLGDDKFLGKYSGKSVIAPWNKAAKLEFPSVDALHRASRQEKYTPKVDFSRTKPALSGKRTDGTKAPLSSDIGWTDKQDVFAHASQWAARLGVKPSSITIGPLPKKWGELQSPSNKLTINEDVLKLPKDLGEYVILHEMTHLLAPNHGVLFQSYLHAYMPDWQQREQRLRRIEKGILQAKAPRKSSSSKPNSGTKATGMSDALRQKWDAYRTAFETYPTGSISPKWNPQRLYQTFGDDLRTILLHEPTIADIVARHPDLPNGVIKVTTDAGKPRALSSIVNDIMSRVASSASTTKAAGNGKKAGAGKAKQSDLYDAARNVTLPTNRKGETIYDSPTMPFFLDHIRNNPRSRIGDGAVLAPQPKDVSKIFATAGNIEKDRELQAAEQARRDASPIYKQLREDGETTYYRSDGHAITIRYRYDMKNRLPVYDVFMNDSTHPAKGFANLLWTPDQALQFIQQTAPDGATPVDASRTVTPDLVTLATRSAILRMRAATILHKGKSQ